MSDQSARMDQIERQMLIDRNATNTLLNRTDQLRDDFKALQATITKEFADVRQDLHLIVEMYRAQQSQLDRQQTQLDHQQTQLAGVQQEVAEVRQDMNARFETTNQQIAGTRQDVAEVKQDMNERFGKIDERFDLVIALLTQRGE